MESIEKVLILIHAQITAINFFLVFPELYISLNVDIIIYEIFILHLCIVILIEY